MFVFSSFFFATYVIISYLFKYKILIEMLRFKLLVEGIYKHVHVCSGLLVSDVRR